MIQARKHGSGARRRQARAALLAAFGGRIRARRLARGLRQEDVAQAMGMSVAYVSLLERGGRNPPFTTVVSLARALRTSAADLA